MKIKPNEVELIGKWNVLNGKISSDIICERINWLTEHYLLKMAISKQWGGWETLFQDPYDKRYWERTYPQSEMHNGGPPTLRYITTNQAKSKYDI